MPNTTRFRPKKVDSIAPIKAPSAQATIPSTANGNFEPRFDCMTNTVAIAAQDGSGNRNSCASKTESVAATAVRAACATEGRSSFSNSKVS